MNKIVLIIAAMGLVACDATSNSDKIEQKVTQFDTIAEALSVSPTGQYCEQTITAPTSRGRGHGVKTETTTVYEAAYMRGDINFDGTVNRDDAQLATQKLYKKAFDSACPAVFDVGGSPQTNEPDGFLTSQDLFLFGRLKAKGELLFRTDLICASDCPKVIDHMSPSNK